MGFSDVNGPMEIDAIEWLRLWREEFNEELEDKLLAREGMITSLLPILSLNFE